MIAEALNLTRAEVHGVVTFYHDFRHEPAGRHVLKLCRAEACQAAGGDALAVARRAQLGVAMGETTADGRVTLEPVYCLGLCPPPAAMLDGRVVGRLDAAGSTRCSRGAAMTLRIFMSRDAGAVASAPTRSPPRSARPPRASASTSRSSAPARAGSTGWSRWSRSGRRTAASASAR